MPNGWKETTLKSICIDTKEKINVEDLTVENYISTENMLVNRGGITNATSLPTISKVSKVYPGDILFSNIRTYFKKLHLSDFVGGCSNDVLIFRPNETVDSKFLFYYLSQELFFDYTIKTSKGTKMPRGDKKAIDDFKIMLPSIDEQRRIASILSSLDDKIKLNNQINHNLDELLSNIFRKMFWNDIESGNCGDYNEKILYDVLDVVDNRGKTPPLVEKSNYPIIDVKALSGPYNVIDYSNCIKYVDEEVYNSFFRSGHPRKYDILISTVGSLAEMKIFMENKGTIAQNVVGLRDKINYPLYTYEYLKFIKNDLISYDIGSVQPSIKVTQFMKHNIFINNDEKKLNVYENIAENFIRKMFNLYKENEVLIDTRDTLLPKLMNGEINLDKVTI